MPDADYAEAKELYELGKMRLSDLAERFNVSRQGLWKKFKKDGVVYGSRAAEVSAAVSAGVKQAVTSTVGQQVSQALERYNDKRAEWIEETRTSGYKSLKQADMLAKKIVADAVKNSASMRTTDDDLKAVARFQKILVENTLTRLDILRANDMIDEDDLPEIHFEDLTDEDILKHHRENGLIEEGEDPDAILAELNNVEIDD
ncbi:MULTISPECIES: helix-turn-helix domain-containing protein [unclassified Ensifer]|uniref:helix-turn-helix domain-containing protein n=1 Tax=unclassified Ensifer TaxID=2633371 RepID=UPI00081338AA|nr:MULTISPECIES: helix-turn-helix domain-containing protein [unclassified Ensifer]OCP21910.1 hypothetical protein BC361_25415 [Ensifer sp. LC54]OCP23310.1 hypothetical protein BC363_25350 [Ensifer sp. LC384]